jgi:hypothetical protein
LLKILCNTLAVWTFPRYSSRTPCFSELSFCLCSPCSPSK